MHMQKAPYSQTGLLAQSSARLKVNQDSLRSYCVHQECIRLDAQDMGPKRSQTCMHSFWTSEISSEIPRAMVALKESMDSSTLQGRARQNIAGNLCRQGVQDCLQLASIAALYIETMGMCAEQQIIFDQGW